MDIHFHNLHFLCISSPWRAKKAPYEGEVSIYGDDQESFLGRGEVLL